MYMFLDEMDRRIAGWMERYGHLLLRYSLGMVFIWFGGLKPFGLSPVQGRVSRTVFWFPPGIFVPILGWWEGAIGVGSLFRPLLRIALFLLFLQLPGAALPLVLLPEICFTDVPFALSLEDQYIIKTLILISAALVIGGTVRHHPAKERFL